MITDMVPTVREALGVSSSYDTVVVPAGIRRAIRFLLRGFNFPKAIIRTDLAVAAVAEPYVTLPADAGKVRAVQLFSNDTPPKYYRLRRTLLGERGVGTMPTHYYQEGLRLYFDVAKPANHGVHIWHNTTSVTSAEPWITDEFEDLLFVLSVMRLSQELRKPEVHAAFAASWQELVPTLGVYLNEVEFNDLDVRMQPEVAPAVPARYGT